MSNRYRLLIKLLLLILTVSLSAACQQTQLPCNELPTPSFEATAQTLANCLPEDASAQSVKQLLIDWERVDSLQEFYGQVISADILPTPGTELVLSYHADLSEAHWNPQGELVVLHRPDQQWQIAYQTPSGDAPISDGATTLKGNWSYHISPFVSGDLTEDGLLDLFISQEWSNGTNGYARYVKFMTVDTANPQTVRFITFIDDGTQDLYDIVDNKLQRTVRTGYTTLFVRKYNLADDKFIIQSEVTDQNFANLVAVTSDGAKWYAYDGQAGSHQHTSFGLYRSDEISLTRFDVPFLIRYLDVLSDGAVYVASNDEVLRMMNGKLMNALSDFRPITPTPDALLINDLAVDSAGDLWIAGTYTLLRFGREQSQQYDVLAHRLLVAPDDSVWVAGWDGKAEGGCCFYHVDGEQVAAYQNDEELPVSAELQAQIRALRDN